MRATLVKALVALLLLASVATADATIPAVVPAVSGVPLGFQQLTPAAATSLTVPAGATLAVIIGDTAAFTWRDDGTAPTAGVGMVWPVGVPLYYNGTLSALQVISATGHVNVSYYR